MIPDASPGPGAAVRRAGLVAVLLGALVPTAVPAQSLSTDPPNKRPDDGARPTVVATYAVESVRLDGLLDEGVWDAAPAVDAFTQSEPDEGLPATERTVVRMAFDATTLYVGAYLYDSRPDALVVSDMRKDFRRDNQDTFEVIFDTFADRRNGYVFATNPAGARADEQVTNEGRETNPSWDAPWSVAVRRTGDGWVVEMAIPFRAIRSGSAGEGVWGVNFSRRIRRNNEVVFWAPVPRAFALTRLSLAGDLVGLPTTTPGRDLRATPYVLGSTVRPYGGGNFDETATAGGDLKFGVTRGLTLDVTVNSDFAQVEADEQQVNLTQFSQFFPEKRDFFLENSGVFYIGDTPRNRRVALAPTGQEDLLPFFSRRIGLGPDGTPVGIDAGVRLTGQERRFQVGLLGIRTRDRDSVLGSDYAVARVRRNVFANSDIGLVAMARSTVSERGDYNVVYGGDATFRLPLRVDWSSFVLQSETDGVTGPRYAFQTSLNREANFDHVKLGVLSIADGFNDELGFYRRTGVRVWSADIGVRPRLPALRRRGVREMHPHIVWSYYTDQASAKVAMRLHTGYTFFLNNGGFAELSVNPVSDRLEAEFPIHPDVDLLPAGTYDWTEWRLFAGSDPSRPLSVELIGILGGLWNGSQRTAQASVTLLPSHRFRATVGLSLTDARLEGDGNRFVRELWTVRGSYSFTTNLFVDALVQYDADRNRFSANLRLNLIHHPLSNLYIVYNELRETGGAALPAGRGLVIKLTQMFPL